MSAEGPQRAPRVLGMHDYVPSAPVLRQALSCYKPDDSSWPAGLVNLRWLLAEAERRER